MTDMVHTSKDVLRLAKKLIKSVVVMKVFFAQQFFDDLRTVRLLADAQQRTRPIT